MHMIPVNSSHFAMRTNAKSIPRKFQQLVDDAVELYNECMKRDSIRACLYNVTLFQRVYPVNKDVYMKLLYLKLNSVIFLFVFDH